MSALGATVVVAVLGAFPVVPWAEPAKKPLPYVAERDSFEALVPFVDVENLCAEVRRIPRRRKRSKLSAVTTPVPVVAKVVEPSVFRAVETAVPATVPSTPRASAPRSVLAATIDGVSIGEVFVVSDGTGVYVEVRPLVERGYDVNRLGGEVKAFDGVSYLRVDAAPMRAVLDEQSGELSIDVPPELLPVTVLDEGTRLTHVQTQTPTSFFVNGGASLIGRAGSVSLEAGFRHGEALVTSGAFWSSNSERVVRGASTATFEFPSAQLQLGVGDVTASASGFSGGALVGGVQFARNLAMDPSLVTMPGVGMSGLAQTPSTLEVYVDERLVSRRAVAPGAFELGNLPVSEGVGTARYVLRDAFGREQAVARPYTLARQTLAPGLQAFSYTLGFERTNAATQSFEYGTPVFVGVHRVGLTPVLTAEAGVHAGASASSVTPRVDLALPFGVVGLVGSGSTANGVQGFAGGLDYALLGRSMGVTASVRARSPNYATLGLPVGLDRASVSAELRGSISPAARWNITAQTRVTLWRDRGAEGQVAVNASWWVTSRVSLSAGVTHSRSLDAVTTSASLMVNVVLGDSVSVTATGTTQQFEPRATIDVQRTPPSQTGFTARAQASVGKTSFGSGSVGYSGEFGRALAGLEVDRDGVRPVLQASSGLVFIGGRVFVTRPVESSFALVRAPGAVNTTVLLEHREVGQTDERGELLVQGLTPWRGNELELEFDDLPDSISLRGDATTRVAARSLSGAIAQFETQELHAVRGTMVIVRGAERIVPAYGTVEVDGVGLPLGADGAFELYDVKAQRVPMRILFSGRVCDVELKVPSLDKSLTEVGEVACTE
ncbi:MAG: fimbria/pilus outer membrane usher protein [Archangium sp.]